MILLSSSTSPLKASDLLKCSVKLPLLNATENNPVDFEWIHMEQNIGIDLATKAAKYPD